MIASFKLSFDISNEDIYIFKTVFYALVVKADQLSLARNATVLLQIFVILMPDLRFSFSDFVSFNSRLNGFCPQKCKDLAPKINKLNYEMHKLAPN